MRQFVWRLQKVLDIKAKEEQVKKRELFKLTEKLAETQGQLLAQRRILRDIVFGIAGTRPKKRLGKQEFFLKYSAASDEQVKRLENRVSELESQQREKIAEVLKVKQFKEGQTDVAACQSCNKCTVALTSDIPVQCYCRGFPQ